MHIESPAALAKRKKAEQAAALAKEKDLEKMMKKANRESLQARKRRDRAISKRRQSPFSQPGKHIGLWYLLQAIDFVEAN